MKKIEKGDLIINPYTDEDPKIAKVVEAETSISSQPEVVGSWTILKVMYPDGTLGTIPDSSKVIRVSSRILRSLTVQAEILDKLSLPNPTGRHPDSCPP